mmetsp:Transcript_28711/g.88777  ORF Transcript_28711/g.88777 Transcript_28711/m.88777 type:complete len:243 (-) Transcript_28711:793-1521(-)
MKPPTGTKYGSTPLSAHFFFSATLAAVRAARSPCAKSPPQSAPWPCVSTAPPDFSCRSARTGPTAASTAWTSFRRRGRRSRIFAPLESARADAPAYVCDWYAVRDAAASRSAPWSRMAPESRWPAPPPIDLPNVTASGFKSQHSVKKQPVAPRGSRPCRPNPHMISSQTTARPRDLASSTYARSRFGGHGVDATDEPHCGSKSTTPSSCSWASRYAMNSARMRSWNESSDSPRNRRNGEGTG